MDNLVNIEGVEIIPLKIINNEDGDILHILRNDYYMFKKFGECYFSELNSSSIKAWKKHKLQTQNLVVPVGLISIVIYDDRKKSKTYKKLLNVKLGKHENYNLLKIPPGLWYGFNNIVDYKSLIFNFTDIPHNPDESLKIEYPSLNIPFKW